MKKPDDGKKDKKVRDQLWQWGPNGDRQYCICNGYGCEPDGSGRNAYCPMHPKR